MIFSLEERKQIKASIESSINNVGEGTEKRFILILLALLNDFEEVEREREDGLEAGILKVIRELYNNPMVLDEHYLNSFSVLAENLNALSKGIWEIKTNLERVYSLELARRDFSDSPCQ